MMRGSAPVFLALFIAVLVLTPASGRAATITFDDLTWGGLGNPFTYDVDGDGAADLRFRSPATTDDPLKKGGPSTGNFPWLEGPIYYGADDLTIEFLGGLTGDLSFDFAMVLPTGPMPPTAPNFPSGQATVRLFDDQGLSLGSGTYTADSWLMLGPNATHRTGAASISLGASAVAAMATLDFTYLNSPIPIGVFDIDNLSGNFGPGDPAVPEPGTLLLVGTGLVAIAGGRRRFKKT